jgi:Ca2+/Na+ antiporter
MKMFKDFFKDRSLGFFIALAGGCLAIIISVIYLISYLSIYVDKMDRVFSILTFLFTLIGGLVILVGELLRIEYISMVGPILIAVALAKHSVEAAYPIADIWYRRCLLWW